MLISNVNNNSQLFNAKNSSALQDRLKALSDPYRASWAVWRRRKQRHAPGTREDQVGTYTTHAPDAPLRATPSLLHCKYDYLFNVFLIGNIFVFSIRARFRIEVFTVQKIIDKFSENFFLKISLRRCELVKTILANGIFFKPYTRFKIFFCKCWYRFYVYKNRKKRRIENIYRHYVKILKILLSQYKKKKKTKLTVPSNYLLSFVCYFVK